MTNRANTSMEQTTLKPCRCCARATERAVLQRHSAAREHVPGEMVRGEPCLNLFESHIHSAAPLLGSYSEWSGRLKRVRGSRRGRDLHSDNTKHLLCGRKVTFWTFFCTHTSLHIYICRHITAHIHASIHPFIILPTLYLPVVAGGAAPKHKGPHFHQRSSSAGLELALSSLELF